MDPLSKTIFEFTDFKAYLLWREEHWPTRGMRKGLAIAMDCQAAYVSQVLNGGGQFSLEQAEKANVFLGHGKDESHFFLLLLQQERAGTVGLRTYFADQIEKIRQTRVHLKNRFDVRQKVNPEDQATYYSNAHYALVHVALTIPSLQTAKSLSEHLALPLATVNDILEFLTEAGLAVKHGQRFEVGDARTHIGHDSKLVIAHHRNWRLKAIEDLNLAKADDLHYSSIVSLSHRDFSSIRESLARAIERAKKTIRESPEEELAVFNVDFFSYKR